MRGLYPRRQPPHPSRCSLRSHRAPPLPQGERGRVVSLTHQIPTPKTIGKTEEGSTMFKDLFSLKGRVALVTGGSRGIGKMIAAGFLAQGAAKVYITARKAGPCEATAKELTAEYGGECIALPIDISTMAGIDMLAAEIRKREPKLDILVNNAGAAWGAD